MRKLLFYAWCFGGLATFGIAPVKADDPWTRYDDGCRLFAAKSLEDITKGVNIGQCIGATRTIMVAGPILSEQYRFCPPTNSTSWQGAKIMLKYIDDHPAKMNEDFFIIGLIAFRAAWPCQKHAGSTP